MQRFICSMALLFVGVCPLRAGLPAIGSPAPEINLDRILPEQPVVNASLKALAGKAVVLEFWGIWVAVRILAKSSHSS